MTLFPVFFSFDKSVGDVNGRISVNVTSDQILSVAAIEACSITGVIYNVDFQVLNSNGSLLEINSTIEKNALIKGSELRICFPGREKHICANNHYQKTTTSRLWKPLAIVALSLSTIGLIVLITIYILNILQLYSFSVVIDAGSTSSKVYLYSWPSNNYVLNADVNQISACKTDLGISSYENNYTQSFDEIKYCLDEKIAPLIPKAKKSTSFLFLGATAGMRMLSYNNRNATEKIMNFLRKSLTKYGLKINDSLTDISIIKGSKEGLSGWITVNYLLNNFPKTSSKTHAVIGALDMGGASTQITFIDNTPSNSSEIFNLKLYGHSYRVYSHSYLCYGKSQAELRSLAIILQQNNFSLTTTNPCMLIGENSVFAAEEIFFKPCIYGKFALDHYGSEIIPPSDLLQKNVNFTFTGSSQFGECLGLVKSMFNHSKCQNDSTCTFNGVYQPLLSGKFGAFSAYPMIKNHLNPKNKDYNLTAYKQRLTYMCQNKNKSFIVNEDVYAKWLCFDLTFMIEVLENLGFNDKNWKSIDFIDKIKDYNVGWSLGYMIDKTSLIPKEKPFLPIENYLFGILFFVLILLLSFGIVFCVLCIKIRNKRKLVNIKYDSNEEQNLLSSNSGD